MFLFWACKSATCSFSMLALYSCDVLFSHVGCGRSFSTLVLYGRDVLFLHVGPVRARGAIFQLWACKHATCCVFNAGHVQLRRVIFPCGLCTCATRSLLMLGLQTCDVSAHGEAPSVFKHVTRRRVARMHLWLSNARRAEYDNTRIREYNKKRIQ